MATRDIKLRAQTSCAMAIGNEKHTREAEKEGLSLRLLLIKEFNKFSLPFSTSA